MDGLDTFRQIVAVRPGMRAVMANGFSVNGHINNVGKLGAGVAFMVYNGFVLVTALKRRLIGRNNL